MKHDINKLTINIFDTCEGGLVVALQEILDQVQRGCYQGGNGYFVEDKDEDGETEYMARGFYEYSTKSKIVTQEELEEAEYMGNLI
ncbi:hypothetical protein [Burkholderia cenocepacia]|uniref:hypothetical protein n=1 Tax=Burkholderia cenocepacia TaxID=95486 RepID=UPI00223742B9|nr:hypothetical protein [Burkholderia cenocepacia]MCW5156441.1 hypothetical protein [Burkholderia cenocepacia]